METSSERNIQVEDIASSDGEPKMVDKVDEGREADIPQHQSDPNPFLVSRGRIAPSGEEEEEEEEQLSVDEAEAKTPPDEPKTADEIDQLSGESTSPQQESEILKNAAQTDPPRVLDLLSKGGNAHAISEDGKSFLKLLVENLDTTLDILKSVLERMRNDQSEAWNAAKQNALAVVLQNLNFDFARLLIEEGAGITQSREGERWPLCHAAWNERADIVSLLLKHNANVNEQDDEGLSALDNACRFGYEGIVDVLLAHKPKPKIDITDDSGMTPLVTSIYYERTSIVEKLLANGADPNGTPDSAWTPLNPACEIGNKEIIDLLLARNGIDINKEDNNGRFPLAEACSSGHREIVSLLLAHKSIEVNRKDNHGWTPLIYACRSGDTKMVELILDGESLADIDMPGNESRTPLSVASELGYFEIARKLVQHGTHGARVNTASDKGWTALHYASYYGHTDVVQLLMDNEAALDSRSHDGCTALHLAGQQGYVETVKTLLRDPRTSVKLLNAQDNKYSTALHMAVFHNGKTTKLDYEDRMVPELYHELVPKHTDVVNILLELGADASKTDAAGHTALFLAVGNWDMDMLRLLLENMATADFGKTNLEYEVLTWTAENCDAHDIFVLLARKGRYMSRKEILGDRETSALCWAACHADSTLVRILLCSIASSSKAKAEKEQKSAEEEVLKFLKSADAQDRGAKSKGNNASKRIDQRVKKEGDKLLSNRLPEIPSKREQYEPVLDLLRNPPPVRTTVSQTCQMPKPSTKFSLKNFDAAIVDFYAGNGLSGFLHRARQVEEIIYDPEHGPKSVMKAAQEKAQELYLDNGKDNVFSSDNFKFRWIHLPANNMQWMNDLMSRIYFEHGKNYDAYGESYKFFRTSCHQVPDASSKSRYMEPGCSRMKLKECEVCQMKKLKDCKNCEQLLATYMPYLTFARYPSPQNTDYERLLEAYSRTAIHGLRTLDESYYQFGSKDGETERRRRNKDQVVTRKLYGDALEGEVSWDLVGIEQLWLWVIDSETIITSSTHRIDGRSNIVELSILDRLKGLGHKENEGVQPDTPQGLSKFIVETCVRFYDQTRYSSADVTPAPHPISWSIQQFFSDAVNGAAIEETGLFKKFIDSKLIMEGKRDHHQGASSSLKDEYVRRTAGLLSDVRDMRDELNMLKSIIGDQHAVQRGLGESDCTAGHLINDLNKMDTATERIYKAVNATLTLEQNVIALNQSEETIQQGRILMAFTVATIIFLPMSFLVSLLAVDITAFPHNSSGDLQYTAGWVFPIIFCVSAVIWIPLILFAFRSQAIRSTGRMQKSIKAHFFNSTENKAGANTGNNTNNNNGNNRIADISGHLGRLYHSRTEQLRWRLPSRIIPDEEAQETHKPVLVEPGKLT